MNHRSTVHLAALSAAMLLSAQAASSAKLNTDFDAKNLLPGAGTDDPMKATSGIYISDGAMITGGGSGTTAKATTEIDYSDHDGAGLPAKNARTIGNITLQHAAGLGSAASD